MVGYDTYLFLNLLVSHKLKLPVIAQIFLPVFACCQALIICNRLKPPREFSAAFIQLIKEKCCNCLELFYDCLKSLKL